MIKWYVYIVRCADDSLYCGIALDVSQRIWQHNMGVGAKYTRGRGPVELVYMDEFEDRSSASKEEYRIKQLSKKKKLELIESWKT